MSAVPRLTTALSGPLPQLERTLLEKSIAIEQWFRGQWQEHTPPFYCSVDLRNSGVKLAPVDTNLFPGGFNNLNPDFHALCVQAAQTAIEKICPDARDALLIPENHTRNQFYLQNVATLARILRLAGTNVRIGSLLPGLAGPMDVDLPDGKKLTLEPLKRNGSRIGLDGFDPCVVVLNNDLSSGIPDILRDLEQPLFPPTHAGWAVRRKSHHFAAYSDVAKEFAEFLGIASHHLGKLFGRPGHDLKALAGDLIPDLGLVDDLGDLAVVGVHRRAVDRDHGDRPVQLLAQMLAHPTTPFALSASISSAPYPSAASVSPVC